MSVCLISSLLVRFLFDAVLQVSWKLAYSWTWRAPLFSGWPTVPSKLGSAKYVRREIVQMR